MVNAGDPSQIMQIGMGFWASKTLLSAVELELFTELGADAMTGNELKNGSGFTPGHLRLPRHPRGAGLLQRDGDGADGALSQHA